jgi:hypothetical protein
MSRTLVAFGKVPQKEPERGTTPGNATALLSALVGVLGNDASPTYDVEGCVRRAFYAMTGEYPEPQTVRAILAPEN